MKSSRTTNLKKTNNTKTVSKPLFIPQVKLLSHQIKPLEYMIARCQKQHGLILNHYMGTGKTITGLVFLQNFPNDKKVIILPNGFQAIWKTEAKKLGINPETFNFVTFNQLQNFESVAHLIENSVCVVDEAHNIYNITETLTNDFHEKEWNNEVEKDKNKKKKINPRLINFLNLMYSTKKILLMSGTLLRHNFLDELGWLINIAAGKENSIVPVNSEEFQREYYKISFIDKLWVQSFKPFLTYNPFKLIPSDIIKSLPLSTNNIADFVYALVSSKVFSDLIQKPKNITFQESRKGLFDINRYKEILINIGKSLDPKTLGYILLMTLVINGTKLVFKYAKAYYEETIDFNRLDIDKLKANKVNRYFSFFNYQYINSTDYPTSKEIIKRVSYTPKQLALLLRVIGIPESLRNQEYVDLEINSNIREAELFKDPYSLKSKFTDKGRIIGNLYENPVKFKEIADIFLRQKKAQTVVYSNFYKSGILLLSKYLKARNIKHTIFDHTLTDEGKAEVLEAFKAKKINMLLLHPDFYEGLSISGCSTFHVLEPVISTSKREQLYARVIRYRSHQHLKPKDRNVTIYNWACTLLYEINKLEQGKTLISQWFNYNDPKYSIIKLVDNFKMHLSPDDRLMSHYNESKNFNIEFNKAIQALSIDIKTKVPLKCCIWTPDDSCSNKKLKSCIE